MNQPAPGFNEISRSLQSGGADAALQTLVDLMGREGRCHDFFEARLMQCRQQAGLQLAPNLDLDDVPPAVRDAIEEGYLAACRETGEMFLQQGKIRDAWMYLRTVGDHELMRTALSKLKIDEENIDAVIETAIYEGVDVELGFHALLAHHGTCNAITTFESIMSSRKQPERITIAGILLRHLHEELMSNFSSALIVEPGDTAEKSTTLCRLLAGCEEMFGEYTIHVDASHLSSVVRFARVLEDKDSLTLAFDLTEYGKRLHENFRFADEPPFEDMYESHQLLFAAQLGKEVEKALEYFDKRAREADPQTDGTLPAEICVMLYARLGRFAEAMERHMALLARDLQPQGVAPSLLELAGASENYDKLLDYTRDCGDLLGFAAAAIEKQRKNPGQTVPA